MTTWDDLGLRYGDERLPARFWAKVEERDGCWFWIGATASWKKGYGYYWHDERVQRAHRVAYQVLVAPVPNELVLDHLCRVTQCVNPAHLEPVTQRTNMRRGANAVRTHCIAGHPFSEENTLVLQNGWRQCRVCKRRRYAEARRPK